MKGSAASLVCSSRVYSIDSVIDLALTQQQALCVCVCVCVQM
jgi:hypothetical protein